MTVDPFEKELEREYRRSIGEKESFRGVTCVAYQGKTCELCKAVKRIMFDKNSIGTPIRDKASKLNQQVHVYSDIYFAANPNDVEVLEYGNMIYKQLLQLEMDQAFNMYKGFIHPETGRNIQIRKTVGAGKDKPSYQVIARESSTKIVNMDVLKKLHDLSKIEELIRFGEIKPVRQSQLPTPLVEVRFLPSFGLHTSKFFHKVPFHWISQEEYDEIQSGKLSPFESTVVAPNTNYNAPPEVSKDGTYLSKIINTPIDKLNLSTLTKSTTFQPGCLSDYNEFDAECGTCDWKDPCKEQMVNKRKAAKGLTPPKE